MFAARLPVRDSVRVGSPLPGRVPRVKTHEKKMTKILVVDDNAVDRRLVVGLLERETDWQVLEASDGAKALIQIAETQPDLIITDLQMPYVDGLELVQTIRRDQLNIPVVLITGFGSERTAVEALKAGAASYSPKSVLQEDLVRTARQVLNLSTHVQATRLPPGQPTPTNLAFVLDNDVGLIGPLIEHLQSVMPAWSDRDRLQIGMALDEALVNAMCHGNLEVPSSLREGDDSEYYEQIKQRRRQPPYCDRRVHVQAEFSDQHLCVQIADEGPGFDPNKIADPTDEKNVQKVGGRGLFLIRAFMDRVVHNEAGNQITMTKFRPTAKEQ